MNWVAISAVGDMLAAMGVIASLVFVGLQLRRDRQATVDESINRRMNGVREIYLNVATTPYLAPIFAKVYKGKPADATELLAREFDLDKEEVIRLENYYQFTTRQVIAILDMPMSNEEHAEVDALFLSALAGSMGVWWEEGKHQFPDSFVTDIDRKRQATVS